MIRTAIPFGYLFIALFLGAILLTGLAMAIRGWLRRRRAILALGSAMVLVVIGVLLADVALESGMQWNPSITHDTLVLGTWADARETLTLRADHTFDYRSSTRSFSGRWSREDWNLRLTAENADSMMRFITVRDELRLMTAPPDDPDMWNGDLGLIRK